MVATERMPDGAHADVAKVWDALARVMDPEIPLLSVADLGMVRAVRIKNGQIEVALAPTYSGCPATEMIVRDVRAGLAAAGYADVRVELSYAPAWTSDWITVAGREKLRAAGIAPPAHGAGEGVGAQPIRFAAREPLCPHCGSSRVERLSAFGSTACKALYRCRDCREPFDYFKPY